MSSYHLHFADDPYRIFDAVHEHVADTVHLNVHLNVEDSAHEQVADTVGLSGPTFLNPKDAFHETIGDSVVLGIPLGDVDSTFHILTSPLVTIITPLTVENAYSLHFADEPTIILHPRNYSKDWYDNYPVILEQSQDNYGDKKRPFISDISQYGSTSLILGEESYLYGDVDFVLAVESYLYKGFDPVINQSEDSYHLQYSVFEQSVDPFNLIDGSIVREDDETIYDIDLNHKVFENSYDYWILHSDTSIQQLDVSFTLNGDPLVQSSIQSVRIYYGRDQYCMTVDVTLHDVSVFNKCTYRSILTVTTEFDTFTFIIDNRKKTRTNGSVSMTVTGTSLTADLGFPHASKITRIFDADLVSNIAQELAAPFTLEWNTVDWELPDNILSVVDQSPIDIIKLLASTCGAVVLTTPDNILKVESKYPINPSEWESSDADLIISDDTDIITQDEVDEVQPGFNKVFLSNQDVVESDSVTIIENAITDRLKELSVYSVPFNSLLVLKTSGGAWITSNYYGIKTESLTEIIEFINGVARTSKPIYGIASYAWKQTSLGTLTFKEDGQVSSSEFGHSLLEITYNTKYQLYDVFSPEIEKVQFYV